MPSNGVIIAIVAGLVAITAIIFSPDGPVSTPSWQDALPPQTPSAAAPVTSAARSDRLANSIAVLPFDTLNAAPDDVSFAAGLHLEVLNQLGKIRSLVVTPGSSVQRYAVAENRPPIVEIAADLGVSAVMQTTVRYAGNQIRLTAELIDPDTSSFKSYDFSAERGSVEELFALQVGIATGMADQLGADITADERRRIDRVPTEFAAAYTSYLRALDYFSRGEFADAIVGLDSAVRGDPTFVDALSLRAYIYAFAQISSESRGLLINDARLQDRNFQTLALEDAASALTLEPDAGLALLTRAVHEMFRLRYRAAGDAFELAIAAAPNNPNVLTQYAQYWVNRGEIGRALPLIERALRLDPNGPLTLSASAGVFNAAELSERAKTAADQGLREAPNNLSLNVFAMFFAADAAGTAADAAATERFAELAEAFAYRLVGKGSDADRVLDLYRDLADTQGVGDADWAQYYVARNDAEAAYQRLVSAVRTYEDGRADPGFAPMVRFMRNTSPAPGSPLAEPRFQRLLDRARLLTRE
jgi:TolB-like protein/Tfp pilus assembly protein PilF